MYREAGRSGGRLARYSTGSVMTWPLAPTRALAGLPDTLIVNEPVGSSLPPATTALALPSSPAATLYLIAWTPDLTAVTRQTNVLVWLGLSEPRAHVFV